MPEKAPRWSAAGLLSLRVGLGGMMLVVHGWGKLTHFSTKAATFSDPLGIGSTASLALITFAEFFCSLLVITGTATRGAASILVVGMATAAFVHHAADPFARKEKALLYGLGFLVVALVGPGPWAVDTWLLPRVRALWARLRKPRGG